MSDEQITEPVVADPFAGMTVDSTYTGPEEQPSEPLTDVPSPEPEADAPLPEAASSERNTDGTFKGKKAKPRDSVQARIDQAIGKQKEAETERDRLRGELEAARRPAAPTPEPAKPVAAAPAARAKPTEDEIGSKYASYADFAEDLADFKAEQRVTAFRSEWQEQQQIREHARELDTLNASFAQRRDTFKVTHPDYDSVINQVAHIALPPVLMEAIVRSDLSPAIAYDLGSHPEICAQLAADAANAPASAVVWMRRFLEARVAAADRGSAPTPKSSNAKPPIKPLGSSPSQSDDDEPDDNESVEQFIRRENKVARRVGRW